MRKALGRRITDFFEYLRCARPRKFNPSEDLIRAQLFEKNTVKELILAPFFFHLVKKSHSPFFLGTSPLKVTDHGVCR
jgi:hypothetical protein